MSGEVELHEEVTRVSEFGDWEFQMSGQIGDVRHMVRIRLPRKPRERAELIRPRMDALSKLGSLFGLRL